MTTQIGVGIVGLGMGLQHLTAANDLLETHVVSIADVNEAKLRAVQQDYGVSQAVTDYRQLLNNPAVDLVIVASPDPFHRDQTVDALEAGKHVLVEKPMAATLEECQDMVEAAQAAGKKLMVGHVVRFTPAFTTMKYLVDRGELGAVYYVGTSYEHDYSRLKRPAAWRFDPKYARHQFLGGGCHAVDLLRHFLPDVESTAAVANHFSLPESPNDDCLVALYRASSGAVGRVLVTAGCKRPYEIALQVYGTDGTVDAVNTATSMRYWSTKMPDLGERWMDVPVNLDNHPVTIQLSHFVSAIREDVELLIPGEEGMRTVALALASIQASHADKWVSVDMTSHQNRAVGGREI